MRNRKDQTSGRDTTTLRVHLCGFTLALLLLAYPLAPIFSPLPVSPERADAILVLGPATDARLNYAISLADSLQVETIYVSVGLRVNEMDRGQLAICQGSNNFLVKCDRPQPMTTLGEINMLQRAAEIEQWQDVIIVTSKTHATRTRLYADRCYNGESWVTWPDEVLSPRKAMREYIYQATAFVKAFTFTATCE